MSHPVLIIAGSWVATKVLAAGLMFAYPPLRIRVNNIKIIALQRIKNALKRNTK